MRRWRGAIAAAVMASMGLAAVPALGSGGPEPTPLYIDHHGGSEEERQRLYRGRLGVVMARAHAPHLFAQWRLLHGQSVGDEAGRLLVEPCCGEIPTLWTGSDFEAWEAARALVSGGPTGAPFTPTDRPGPNYTSLPNCFGDAFARAAATLRDRVARHGRDAPAVRAWLAAQDAVFEACGREGVALPPPIAGAPLWLRADRAYQEAAFALYNFRNAEAATRFAAIANDPTSPWQPMGIYLGARALQREALARPSPQSFALVRRVLNALAGMPAGSYGQSQVPRMLRALDYRDRPAVLLAELDRTLNRPEPPADAEDFALALRDYLRLARGAETRPDAADWIFTLQSEDRSEARDHAKARWRASGDLAWLVAALSLTAPDDADARALADEADRVAIGHAAWLSARYHLIRLTIGTVEPAQTRARLAAILARGDLSLSDRNLFTAARAQVATDLHDFARFALRRPYCRSANPAFCTEEGWPGGDRTLGRRGPDYVGFGADAAAIIDRLPLADRIALSRSAALPAPLRLDVALTSFARAVQLQDNAAIDRLAGDLALLLPQLRRDWRAIVAQRPGPAKRFATYFVMAKLPGLRPDLPGYRRPLGTVRQFDGYWLNWMIPPRGQSSGLAEFPAPSDYRPDYYWSAGEDSGDDLTCLGQCGLGSFPLRLPAFVAARQARAAAERAAFITGLTDREGNPRTFAGAPVSVWDEALAFARAHPRDPRSPETLYRLIRVARWGGNHNHLGRRAFQLLHRRYPGSDWARRSPYYYD